MRRKHLNIPSWFQLCRIIIGQDTVGQRGSKITTTFAPIDDDFGNIPQSLDSMLALLHMHKAHRSTYNSCWMTFSLTNQFAQFKQSSWSIAKYIKRIGR